MKRFATKTLVMTAALAAFALGASAQSMNAEIPFNFRAGDAVLSAGSYRINVGALDHSVIQLTNQDTKKSVLLIPRYRHDADRTWAKGSPKVWFACTGQNCVLTTLWNGDAASAVVIAMPDRQGKELAETRVVNLSIVKTE